MASKYDQHRELFLRALASRNWNDTALHATELLKINDQEPMVWSNRGVALQSMGFPLDAILNYDRSISLDPSALNYSNKGAAFWDMGNADRAIPCLTKAIELDPLLAQAHLTLGNIYKHQGDLKKATSQYRRCVEGDPEYADGHLVLGMALLKQGALQEGWKEYEWRWKSGQLPPRKLKCPQWRGEDLTNKTILVYGEQGLGDIIQFARYVRVLGNHFPRAKIIIEGRPPLKRLLKTIPEAYAVINAGERVPEVDYGISMMTLMASLTPNMGAIPSQDKEYLIRPEDVAVWNEKLQPLFERNPTALKVGICWAGMSRDQHPSAAAIDAIRSATLEAFAPLAAIPNILWVSLQKGPPAEQIKNPISGMTIGDFTEDMYDFYETCCAIENCDLVISVDTAVVHAAASIGKPTWLLSRWDGCWRWFGDRLNSPWYPSLQQFVQLQPGDWDGMMKVAAKQLAILAKDKNAPELNLTMAK